MFENMLLDQEQNELLLTLVEAARNVPRDKRQNFFANDSVGKTYIKVIHEGFPRGESTAFRGDIEELGRADLLALTREDSYTLSFYVKPIEFKYYEEIKKQINEPVQRVELVIKTYLDSDQFKKNIPKYIKNGKMLRQCFGETILKTS